MAQRHNSDNDHSVLNSDSRGDEDSDGNGNKRLYHDGCGDNPDYAQNQGSGTMVIAIYQ